MLVCDKLLRKRTLVLTSTGLAHAYAAALLATADTVAIFVLQTGCALLLACERMCARRVTMTARKISHDQYQLLTPAAHMHCAQATSPPKLGLVLAGVPKPDPNGELVLVPGRYAAFTDHPNVAAESTISVAPVGSANVVR